MSLVQLHGGKLFIKMDVGVAEGGKMNGVDPALLRPILNDAEGFYQIGATDSCTEQFILSVTIAFASNLPQVSVMLCS